MATENDEETNGLSRSTFFNSKRFRSMKSSFSILLSPKNRLWKKDPAPKSESGKHKKNEDNPITGTDLTPNEYKAPTPMHKACHEATSIDDLDTYYKCYSNISFERQASVRDTNDQSYPLHVLSHNKSLSWSTMNQANSYLSYTFNSDTSQVIRVANFVTNVLLPAFEDAAKEKDDCGFIPFERALHDWIQEIHEGEHNNIYLMPNIGEAKFQLQTKNLNAYNLKKSFTSMESRDENVASNRAISALSKSSGENDSQSFDDDEDKANYQFLFQQANETESLPSRTSLRNDLNDASNSSKHSTIEKQFPNKVCISAHAEMSLILLSKVLEYFSEKTIGERNTDLDKLPQAIGNQQIKSLDEKQNIDSMSNSSPRKETQNQLTPSETMIDCIVSKIASIPNLIKTFLLLNEVEKKRVFGYLVVRKVMMNKNSIGVWLTNMLQNPKREVRSPALNYFHILSNISGIETSIGNRTKSSPSEHKEIIEAVASLEGLIPSMLTLDEKVVEDVATTRIISRVLDKMITRSFAVYVVFCDAIFISLLIVSFRESVVCFINNDDLRRTLKWIYVTNSLNFYFIVREIGKAVSLSVMISVRRFWSKFFWTVWNMVDIFSIAMACISNLIMRLNLVKDDDSENSEWTRACLAVTTGLLWLKVLGLLKSVNMQLATFVLAIVQITRDIVWFLVILVATVICFAQIFITLLFPKFCSAEEDYEKKCDRKEYYLKVYSILLGDWGLFGRDDFTTTFSVSLFVIFSFMVVVVLLNVLIAIVSDSYEKCLLRSKNLFGRARVMLLAELVSFQNLLYSSKLVQMEQDNASFTRIYGHNLSSGGVIFFSFTFIIICIWMIVEFSFYKSGEKNGDLLFGISSFFVNVIIFSMILIVLRNSGEITKMTSSRNLRWGNLVDSVQLLMLRLLGTSEVTFTKSGDSDDWRGRVNYLQREMARMTAESIESASTDIKVLQGQLDQKFTTDFHSLEKRLETIENNVSRQLKVSEQRIEALLKDNMQKLFAATCHEDNTGPYMVDLTHEKYQS